MRLSIHACGGYDVVRMVRGKVEGEMVEFSGVAANPFELEALVSKYRADGADVVDYRTPEKLRLAGIAKEAVARLEEMVALATSGGVDPEAIAKCRMFVVAATRAATETSC